MPSNVQEAWKAPNWGGLRNAIKTPQKRVLAESAEAKRWRDLAAKFLSFFETAHQTPYAASYARTMAEKVPWRHEDVEAVMKPFSYLLEESSELEGPNPALDARTWSLARDVMEVLLDRVTSARCKLRAPFIDAGPNGDAHLLWQSGDRYALIVVDRDSQNVKWFVRFPDGRDFRGPFDPTKIDEKLLQAIS